jgi:hypothetical protein
VTNSQPEITIPLPLRPAGRVPPPGPFKLNSGQCQLFACTYVPGSDEKIDLMAIRASLKLPLFNDRDASLPERLAYLGSGFNRDLSKATGAAQIVEEISEGRIRIVSHKKAQQSRGKPLSSESLRRRQRKAA